MIDQHFFSAALAIPLTLTVLLIVPVMLIVERRGSAFMQRRVGPNRVGFFGLLQPLADAVKLIFKEDLSPRYAHKIVYHLAPALGVVPPFLVIAAMPISGTVLVGGQELNMQVINLNVGLLFVMAISSLHVFSVLAAGWSSSNKFSLLGALRASSQMISYEIAIGISLVSVILAYGTADLRTIVALQEASVATQWWRYLVLLLPFIILWISSFAETNRLPFDLPEGESELVSGYHTEYSGLKFAMFFLGEYAAMFAISALLCTLFLGGYNVPFFSQIELREIVSSFTSLGAEGVSYLVAFLQFVSFVCKSMFFMLCFVWVRWTLPRFRYDQLMNLGWKVLLPVGALNALAAFVLSYFIWSAN